MSYKAIILILGMIAAAIYLIKARDANSTLIVTIQAIAVGLMFTVDLTIGYYVFGAAVLLALLYPYISKDSSQEARKWMWLFLIPISATFVIEIFHLPGYGILRLLLLLPIGVFIYALINIRKFKNEMGFMILFTSDAIIKVIGLFIK